MTQDRICCETMGRQLSHSCEQHSDLRDCPDVVVIYSPRFDEFRMPIRDGGTGSLNIQFCPWCGGRLAESKREMWFSKLESLGFDSPLTDDIPIEYRSDKWWRSEESVDRR